MNTPSLTNNPPSQHPDVYWRSMRYFTLYRIIVASILFGTYFLMHQHDWWENYDSTLYFRFATAYLALSLTAAIFTRIRWPRFNRQLTLQVIGDIGFIVVLMHAAGGVKSGLGLLLVVAIAGAAVISHGRLALFYAALASISLLLEQTWQLLTLSERYDDYSHAVMLSLSCFATAWLAHSFAKRARQSEDLASQRGVDLENLAQVNQLIIQDMQDGVLVVDKDFRLRHHNTRAENLLGIHAQDWTNAPIDMVAPEISTRLRQWISDNHELRAGVIKLVAGSKELRLRFMPVSADRSLGTVIFIEDWSQVQSQARQLKLAALGRLTANIAHEIRNPLSAISHANQLLQEENGIDSTARRLLQIIDDNVLRLDQIVQDVLQLNRRDRAQQEVISMDQFLNEFHHQFCQVEKIPSAGFVLDIVPSKAITVFDRRHLHQILWNLCRNGWRHGHNQPGSLRLRLDQSRRKAEMVIEVTDDGPGISDEVRPHLFEPFFTTESSGTGLGLYIARELCEANGASIEYSGSRPGTCFSIYLKQQNA